MKFETIQYRWLGLVPYKRAWEYQKTLADQVASGQSPPTLLLLEHPPTYTFGRSGDPKNLLWDEAELQRRGIEVHWVDRGGDVTYHGPGQLVGYPLLPLGPAQQPLLPQVNPDVNALHIEESQDGRRIPQADFTGYLRRLEAALVQTLAQFGLVAGQIPGKTGVWVQSDVYSRCKDCPPEERLPPAKVAAIGVKVDARGITRHGFALNVNPDMRNWDGIIGCGLEGYAVTSLEELTGQTPPMDEIVAEIKRAFGRVFQVALLES